jgi:hypothetical protein
MTYFNTIVITDIEKGGESRFDWSGIIGWYKK